MDGDLARAELRSDSAISEKIHGGILLLLAKKYRATDGGLAACRISKAT